LALFNGKLYIGTYGGGVTRRDTPAADRAAMGTYEAFPETAGFKASSGCLVAAGGALYLGTDGQGLFRLSADGQRFDPVKAPLPSPHITAILPAKDGLFIGTDEGLAKLPLPLPGEGA
jgi:ligand-binding sensor domain-containing protein